VPCPVEDTKRALQGNRRRSILLTSDEIKFPYAMLLCKTLSTIEDVAHLTPKNILGMGPRETIWILSVLLLNREGIYILIFYLFFILPQRLISLQTTRQSNITKIQATHMREVGEIVAIDNSCCRTSHHCRTCSLLRLEGDLCANVPTAKKKA
jgi:hypothetical protein